MARKPKARAMAGARLCAGLQASCVGAFVVQQGSDVSREIKPYADVGAPTFSSGLAGDGWTARLFAGSDVLARGRFSNAKASVLTDRRAIDVGEVKKGEALSLFYADLAAAAWLGVCRNNAGGGEVAAQRANGLCDFRLGFHAKKPAFGLTLRDQTGDRARDDRRYEFSRPPR